MFTNICLETRLVRLEELFRARFLALISGSSSKEQLISLSGFLVGEGARDWAVRHGVPAVSSETLISDKANKLYKHYKKKLDAFRSENVGE